MENTAIRIKNIRRGLGLTVGSLAQKLDISRSYLTFIENGDRPLPRRLVPKLATAFRLPQQVVHDWYLDQELEKSGIARKTSRDLIRMILKMTPAEKQSLLQVLKEEKNPPFLSNK